MKRILSAILLVAAVLTVSVFAASPVTVTLNGEKIDCASYGQEAEIVEGRTLVPLRAIFEALGASVEWNGETKTVTSVLDETEIKLTIGEKALYKNGETVELDVPAMIMNGRTMVPVRAISESFGVKVEWDGETRTVVLFDGVLGYNAYLENILAGLIPKSELDKEIVATAGGLPISAANARSAALTTKSNGFEFDDEEAKKEIEAFYSENAALVNFAYNEGVILDEADINKIKSQIFALQLQLGDNYDKAFAESPYTEYFYHLNTSLYSTVKSSVIDKYSAPGNDTMYSLVLDYLEKNEYVRAKHILIQYPKNPTEEQREAAFSKSLDVLVKVKAMKDISEFDALIEQYNEDPGMKSNPDGYCFTRGEMVKPFENATYALEIGKTSSLVETDYGFHIILRLPLDDESLVNTSVYRRAVSGVITNTLYKIAEGIEVEYSENYTARMQDFGHEYDTMFSE
ncbi:MAG: peptidylprolyl isomerase [Clostridia bacterium]|nr:peptidylprolyl isomerase [Clostridia bacterium]